MVWPFIAAIKEVNNIYLGDVQLFPAFGISRDMPTNLNLDSCLEVVKPWLEECSKNHPACKPPLPSESEMPIRILDIESFESGFIRLVESSRIQCKDYITLSHCWGEVQPITTMKSNLKYHYSGIPIHQLPATFYEAVLITSALKIQYLWIDSLCIVQDDPYDWEAEAAKMATVYRSSYLTLAALHSPNSHGGCFSSRYKKETPDWMNPNCILRAATESKSLQHRGVNNVIHTTMTRLLPRNAHSLFMGSEPNDTPLGSRAWALQERLMASRTLYFHYEELVWECHACLACECQALQRYKDILQYLDIMKSPVVFCTKSNVHLERNSSRETILREWLRLVTVYSTLKLSKRSDVLPALSGLARHFSDLTPLGVYAAGIWSCDLARSLVWEKTLQTYDDRDAYSHTSTPYDEGMPSWSWTSIISGFLEEKFQVSYEAVLNRGFIQDDHFDVTPEGSWESSIQDSSANAFNLSSGKRIRVSGLVIAANYSGLWGDRPGPSFYTQAPGLFQKSVKFSPDADLSLPGPYQTLEGELLSCIFVGKTGPRSYDGDYVRLVLVLKSSKEQGVFRRIGYNEVGRLDPSFENANVDTLVIM
jgi:hypothetical protein